MAEKINIDEIEPKVVQFLNEITTNESIQLHLENVIPRIQKISDLSDIIDYYKEILKTIEDVANTILYENGIDFDLQIPILWNRLLDTIAGYGVFYQQFISDPVDDVELFEFYRSKAMDHMIRQNMEMCFVILTTLELSNRQEILQSYREEGNEVRVGLEKYLDRYPRLNDYLDILSRQYQKEQDKSLD